GRNLRPREWRGCAGRDPGFDLAQIFLGEIQVSNAILLIAKREDKIPIRSLDTGDRIYCLPTKIGISLLESTLRYAKVPTSIIHLQISQKRLRVPKAEAV